MINKLKELRSNPMLVHITYVLTEEMENIEQYKGYDGELTNDEIELAKGVLADLKEELIILRGEEL